MLVASAPPIARFANPGRVAMRRAHDRLDVAAHVEVSDDLAILWREQRNDVAEDEVHNVLVKDVAVAERVDVELEGAQFDATRAGHVAHVQHREIGKTRARTQAGELGNRELDRVVTLRRAIVEGLELRLADRLRAVQLGHRAAPRPAGRRAPNGIGENRVLRSYVSTPSTRFRKVTIA